MLAALARLAQDHVEVLVVLIDLAHGREVAGHHLVALDVHDLRIGGRLARDLEKAAQIEAEPLGEHQALGERHAVEPEDVIDRELGLGRGSRPAR